MEPSARGVIACAALLGFRFDAAVLAECCDTRLESTEQVLGEACRVGLLVVESGKPARYRFRHALYRSAIRDGLSPPMQRALHARIAAALERLARNGRDDDTIAWHHSRASPKR